jgi:adenine-specific DNA-methyltransferase
VDKVIGFIGQFEDELVKVWNKPKFVRHSNYVITLDRISNLELITEYNSICRNFSNQIEEWQKLGKVDDEDFTVEGHYFILENHEQEINPDYLHLPIDTRVFQRITKLKILSLFDES